MRSVVDSAPQPRKPSAGPQRTIGGWRMAKPLRLNKTKLSQRRAPDAAAAERELTLTLTHPPPSGPHHLLLAIPHSSSHRTSSSREKATEPHPRHTRRATTRPASTPHARGRRGPALAPASQGGKARASNRSPLKLPDPDPTRRARLRRPSRIPAARRHRFG